MNLKKQNKEKTKVAVTYKIENKKINEQKN